MGSLSDIANVEPSIFHGLFDNVRFEPWTEFQTIMSEAMRNHAQLAPVQSLNQLLHSLQNSEDPESDDVIPDGSSPVLVALSRSAVDIESIKGLLLNEIDSVCRWIEAVYPRTNCKIREDLISSEYIFCNASKDMIRNFMEILLEKEKIARKGQDSPRSSHSQSPNAKSIPLKPVIPLNQLADRWVFRYAHDKPTTIPVCCYQFEDLEDDITGILPFYRYVPPDNRDSSESDFDIDESTARLQSDMYIPGASPEQVAAHFNNTLFSLSHSANEADAVEYSSKRLVVSIAQAISRAILTKTGCIYLTNHKMALALRVKEDPAAEHFGAKVLVTGAFLPNKKPGRSDAMLSLTKFCFDLDMKFEDKVLLDPMRRLIMGFSYSTYNSIDRIVPLSSSWHPGEMPASPRDQESLSLSKNSGEDESDASRGVGSLRATNLVRSNEDKLLRKLFGSTKELLAVGYSGVVVHGMLEGEAVAIKTWNGRDILGFGDLRREIRVYQVIKQKCPALLGSVVPTFNIGWDRPDAISVYHKELVLVTGLMGTEITKRQKTIRVLDGDKRNAITREEKHQICASAMNSLKQLHDNGFQHGDIAFRNMRVARNKDADKTWKVWWIDLGRSFYSKDVPTSLRIQEMKACEKLFTSRARTFPFA